ncbi:RING-H2 finger protein ATL1-like [Hibiscus syriacus]|nr:RING-H2 finger protein ATL1-like [Hibiscus syriacus]
MMWNCGLDESAIQEILTFWFEREGNERSIYGCVVCLNEFQEHDILRVLPKCNHAFHLDCIDIWLQSNENCPLCRTSISRNLQYPINHIVAPSSSPQDSEPSSSDSLTSRDEDFIVIEFGEGDGDALLSYRQQERDNSRESLSSLRLQPRVQSSRKPEQKHRNLKSRKQHQHHLSIMGDECINVRQKGDNFSIQPTRRSFSLDSAVDRQLQQSVQAVVQQSRHPGGSNTTEK